MYSYVELFVILFTVVTFVLMFVRGGIDVHLETSFTQFDYNTSIFEYIFGSYYRGNVTKFNPLGFITLLLIFLGIIILFINNLKSVRYLISTILFFFASIFMFAFPYTYSLAYWAKDIIEDARNVGADAFIDISINAPLIISAFLLFISTIFIFIKYHYYEDSLNILESGTININNDSPIYPEYINEIKGLKELLDRGAITEDEFNAKKKELLNILS